MNLNTLMILETYREKKDDYIKLGNIVHDKLTELTQESKIKMLSIEHRVKTEESLKGKLLRTEGKYRTFDDITDILGLRAICFFQDDVDVIGKAVENEFDIDWDNFSDKRKLIDASSFGYLSLHYICSLKKDKGYPKELTGLRFEIQIRTILQHTWSDIEHDLGYKSDFGIPRELIRAFSRVAGLLEIADNEFMRIRDNVVNYTNHIRDCIINDTATDLPINMITLREYVYHNKPLRKFINELSEICGGAEIQDTEPSGYIEQLSFLGITTIGQLHDMFYNNKETALKLAKKSLLDTDLDILSSSVALRFICRAELINKNYPEEKTVEFLLLSVKDRKRAERQARVLFDYKKEFGL